MLAHRRISSNLKFVGTHLHIHLQVHEPCPAIYTWHLCNSSGPPGRCLALGSLALIKRQGAEHDEIQVHRGGGGGDVRVRCLAQRHKAMFPATGSSR